MADRPSLHDLHEGDTYTHLNGIELCVVPASEVTILIGADSSDSVLAYDVRQGEKFNLLPFRQNLVGLCLVRLFQYCPASSPATEASMEPVGESVQSFWVDRKPSVNVNLVQSKTDE